MSGGALFLGQSLKGLELSFVRVGWSKEVKPVRHCAKGPAWETVTPMMPVELDNRACASS